MSFAIFCKKEVFRESNQWKFFKGVSPWFWSKNRTFLCIFFGQIKQEKILFLYSDEKRKLLIPEKLSFKKV